MNHRNHSRALRDKYNCELSECGILDALFVPYEIFHIEIYETFIKFDCPLNVQREILEITGCQSYVSRFGNSPHFKIGHFDTYYSGGRIYAYYRDELYIFSDENEENYRCRDKEILDWFLEELNS